MKCCSVSVHNCLSSKRAFPLWTQLAGRFLKEAKAEKIQVAPLAPARTYYNLDGLPHVPGLCTDCMPEATWGVLKGFCLTHGITQRQLDRLYQHFSYTLETSSCPVSSSTSLEYARQVGIAAIPETAPRYHKQI